MTSHATTRWLALAAAVWIAILCGGQWWLMTRRTEIQDPAAVQVRKVSVLEAGPDQPLSTPPPDAAWLPATLPDNWDGQRPRYTGYVWYRLDLPDEVAQLNDAAIYLPVAGMNAQIWINGHATFSLGSMSQQLTRHFYTPLLFPLPAALLAPRGNWIDILVVGHPGYRCGLAPVWIGSRAPLYDAWRWRRLWQNDGSLVTIVFNLAIGLHVLLLWWRERSQVAFAWFGSAVTIWGLRDLNYVVTDPPMSDLLFAELCVSGAAWFTALFAIFAERFCKEEDPTDRVLPAIRPIALAYALASTAYFLSAPDYGRANAAFPILALIGLGLTLWSQVRLVRLAFRQRRTELVAVAFGSLTYLVLLANDLSISIDKTSLGEFFIRQYAALPLFAALTATLSRRYLDALRQTRELSRTLQARVDEQRLQLERSFDALKDAERESARTQERARMMGDLHDGLGLHLVAALRQARSPETPREAVAESLQDCMDDLRVAIDSLDELEREPVALLASLRFRLAPRFEALGIRLLWQVHGDVPRLTLDAEGALHLLRIVQEALTNALKHGSTREVGMSVSGASHAVVVTVVDDGPGFDVATVRQGRGLVQMRMRAARLGAQIQFSPGTTGSLIRLILPCPGEAAPGRL